MAGDLCWSMADDTWGPIDPMRVGVKDHRYMALARPNHNNLIARAKRAGIKWVPFSTLGEYQHGPHLLRVKGRVVMGRRLALDGQRQGWFLERVYGWPTETRIYPTAWAPLPKS